MTCNILNAKNINFESNVEEGYFDSMVMFSLVFSDVIFLLFFLFEFYFYFYSSHWSKTSSVLLF